MPTRSTEEAILLLKLTRAWLIEEARRHARLLIAEHGQTHSREVLEAMQRDGMQRDIDAVKGYWLGAVFRSHEFKWTGKFYEPPEEEIRRDEAHNIHSWRPVRVWTLR